MDDVARLELALLLTHPGARRRADDGSSAAHVLDRLDPVERGQLRREAEDLAGRGVLAVVRGGAAYPRALRQAGPRALFYRGPLEALDRPSLGICGSRNASPSGLRAATLCGALCGRRGVPSISGYARGVDSATHVSSLEAGGRTVMVLPEGIDHFRLREGVRDVWDDARALVLSSFAPTQPWTVHGAMARNSVIIALSAALVVVEAGATGGTLAAGRRALTSGGRVLVLRFGPDTAGNRELLAAGAVAVRNAAELEGFVDDLEHVVDERDPERVPGASQGVLSFN